MGIGSIVHLLLHILVPLALARLFARGQWLPVWGVMMATMLVDLDHLLATPLYDPERCSVTTHPLHRVWFWPVYGLMALWPKTRWWGIGLLVHMGLDTSDCARQDSARLISEFFRI
ncbi:DUF6122 family protein [Simiduia agarivorans]|uniref:Membrane-bound metal-dependent hydrolase n=1 Tax=Simiduia agarivorans (strain DSM 21679 / JCM 13881 / BCRC 17597 / SA1) TaxID=1117647 RepID=K4KHQ8_SIMAS|nr:DUF6122 family protein [Simiduia agarivorans]AFU98561.1 hypothetical protein M5M_06830 [Simiduia agarivorans SA1 = DSM 21679]